LPTIHSRTIVTVRVVVEGMKEGDHYKVVTMGGVEFHHHHHHAFKKILPLFQTLKVRFILEV
jgi:hypothetical protein